MVIIFRIFGIFVGALLVFGGLLAIKGDGEPAIRVLFKETKPENGNVSTFPGAMEKFELSGMPEEGNVAEYLTRALDYGESAHLLLDLEFSDLKDADIHDLVVEFVEMTRSLQKLQDHIVWIRSELTQKGRLNTLDEVRKNPTYDVLAPELQIRIDERASMAQKIIDCAGNIQVRRALHRIELADQGIAIQSTAQSGEANMRARVEAKIYMDEIMRERPEMSLFLDDFINDELFGTDQAAPRD